MDRAERDRAAAWSEVARSGPPKRFAQGIGAAMSTAALLPALVLQDHVVADCLSLAFVVARGSSRSSAIAWAATCFRL
jgi:hypothetical protein